MDSLSKEEQEYMETVLRQVRAISVKKPAIASLDDMIEILEALLGYF